MGTKSNGSSNSRPTFSRRSIFFVFSFFLLLFYISPMYKSMKSDCDMPLCLPIRHILGEYPLPGYLVYTPTCKISEMDPFDSSVKPFIRKSYLQTCSKPLIYSAGKVLKYHELHHEYEYASCCVSSIHRKSQNPTNYDKNADWGIDISGNCTEIPKTSGLPFPSEFLQVTCTSLKNGKTKVWRDFYGTPFPPQLHSNETQAKVNHWEQLANINESNENNLVMNPPPSILIVGIDSISRMHYLRSMPETRQFLRDNDFIEMKGYTKIGENTFPNVMGYLAGMELYKYPCWTNKDKKQKIDDCPLIWKNFSSHNYVTAFLEDSPGLAIFNYMKTGFVEQPTDYYLRTLGVAFHGKMDHTRGYQGCVGGLSQTEMMLRYMNEFIEAMGPVPYFLLSWFTSAAHDDFNGLKPLDTHYRDLLHNAVYNPAGNGNNTIVLFISDHGYRFGKFRETFLGYYEESLPFFFMRLPPSLKALRPQWYENLRVNSQRLTSPLDLHATFEDILSLSHSSSSSGSQGFQYTHSNWDYTKNRTVYSFFEENPINRTCESALISQQYCRCGVSATVGKKSKSSVRFGNAVIRDVNDMMWNEIRGNSCVPLRFKEFLYVREIGEGDVWNNFGKLETYKDHLVALEAAPSGAHFEAKVRLFLSNDTMSVVGDISRINSYEGQNECLKDYKLKNYCMCRDYFEKTQLAKKTEEAKKKMKAQNRKKKRKRKSLWG